MGRESVYTGVTNHSTNSKFDLINIYRLFQSIMAEHKYQNCLEHSLRDLHSDHKHAYKFKT